MDFYNKVYEITKQIPKGKVATYGQIAQMIGNSHCSRAVGYALHANKMPVIIPCHRVVNRFGQLAKSFAFGGASVQKQLLENESVEVSDDNVVDLSIYQWRI